MDKSLKEEEVEKYGLERDLRGEEVKVDSVTNSGIQCTDFFVLPDDDTARSFGTLRWRAMCLAFMEADSSSASGPRGTASNGGGSGGRTLGTGT